MAGRIGKEGTEGWDEGRGIRFARAAKREKCAKLAFPPSLPKNHRETVTMLSALVSERSLGHYEYLRTMDMPLPHLFMLHAQELLRDLLMRFS